MNTSQALAEAKRWTNTFRSFQHIEDVLAEVHAANGVLSDVKAEIERLNLEIKKAQSLLKSKESALGAFLELEIEKRKRSAKESLTQETDLRENLNKQETAFELKMAQQKEDLTRRMSKREAKLEEINGELAAARTELSTLKTAIMGLQNQIGNLQPGV